MSQPTPVTPAEVKTKQAIEHQQYLEWRYSRCVEELNKYLFNRSESASSLPVGICTSVDERIVNAYRAAGWDVQPSDDPGWGSGSKPYTFRFGS